MRRKAIIIGSPGKENTPNYLHGVEFDIKNYIRFLKSPTGGAWTKDEIIPVLNPDKDKLIKFCSNIDTDYLLLIYSGHGAYSIDGNTILAINRTQFVKLRQLFSKVPKQMYIIDACRSFIDSGIYGFLGEELRNFPSRLSHDNARNIFNKHLNRCEDGLIICYSCSKGEESIDSNDGGYFTTSLLDTANKWVEKASHFKVLPVDTAFSRAKSYILNNLTDEQNPQIKSSNKRKMWFPFAIRRTNQLLLD